MIDFDTYIKIGEPGGKERAEAWRTAIGLQNVDGLSVSEFLFQLARQQIEGEITMDEVTQKLNEHYKHNKLYSSTYEIVPPNSEMIQQIKEESSGKREQRKFTCYAKQEQVQAHSVWLNELRRPGMYEQDSAI